MTIFRRPRFKRHYHVRTWPPDTVVLFWEGGNTQLHGPLMAMLAPLLDGSRTVEQIIETLHERITAVDVAFGLSQLAERGFIIETDDDEEVNLATFRDVLGVDVDGFRERLNSADVAVHSLIGVEPEAFASALRSLGIRVGHEGTLTVVLADQQLQPELEAFHRESLRTGQPWTIIKPLGSVAAFGPIFQPGETPCWNCLALRLRESPETQSLAPVLDRGVYSRMNLPTLCNAALNLAATEIMKWIVSGGELGWTIFTLDSFRMEMEHHVVTRRDDCPACGVGSAKTHCLLTPIKLSSRKKLFTADGGHRPADPVTVFEKYRHHISPVTGIVHTLTSIGGVDPTIVHVYGAGHNFVLDPLGTDVARNLTARSMGKGMSAAQARTSALCETLERYSGRFRGNEPRLRSRARDLRDEAIYPNRCLNFSVQQYATHQPWDGDPRAWVPEPFDDTREIEWTPVWSLTELVVRYIPTACCYYGYPTDKEHDFARADSNGCAAGVTLEDAIFQGFLEVVERDSMSIWWHNRLLRPAFAPSILQHSGIQHLREYYASLDRSVWVLDITADLGIPAAVAISMKVNTKNGTKKTSQPKHLLMGAGAHFDPAIAVSRALTEMNQALPSSLREGLRISDEALCQQKFLHPHRDRSAKKKICLPQSDDLRDDIQTCVRLAKERKLEVLVLDQSRADVGLPVVKVIVPGMRHFWRRLGPGRLYDVPVQMGWLSEPIPEQLLNPAVIGM